MYGMGIVYHYMNRYSVLVGARHTLQICTKRNGNDSLFR